MDERRYPILFTSRMLKKSASFVLASLKGSTYPSVRLASSLAAAALDGHFEHLASRFCATTIRKITVDFEQKRSFFRNLLGFAGI
jgi:hypothetical protein